MKLPDRFQRLQDEKIFRITYMGFLDERKSRIIASDGEIDDVIWVSDNFFVGGESGHTYNALVGELVDPLG